MFYLGRPIYQNEIISFAFERALYGLPFDAVNSLFRVLFWKTLQKYGKTAVFPGGYGRIEEIPLG